MNGKATALTPFVPLVAMVAALASGLLFVFGLTSSFWGLFVTLCSPLPIYLAGLGWGSLASGFAGVLAVTGVLMFVDPVMTSIYSVGFVIPAFILSHLAIQPAGGSGDDPRWRSSSGLATAFLVVGMLEVTLLTAAAALSAEGLAGSVRGNLAVVAGWLDSGTGDAAGAVAELVDFWDSLALGSLVGGIMLAHAVMGALAQGLLVSLARPWRPSPAFWQLRLPAWPSVAAIVLAAAAFGIDQAAGDREALPAFLVYLMSGLVLVLGTGFLLQGLAVLHALTRGMGMQPVILMGSYAVVLLFQPFGVMVFAAVGFAECWAGFRERFGVADDA